MTAYGSSPWIKQFPSTRVPAFPKHSGADAADVVIIGGGLTGPAAARPCPRPAVREFQLAASRGGRVNAESNCVEATRPRQQRILVRLDQRGPGHRLRRSR